MDNIILLFGGDSCERDISIITAVQLYENIDKTRYNIYPIYMYNSHMYYVKNMNIDEFISYKPRRVNRVVLENGILKMYTKLGMYKSIKIDSAILATHGGIGENGAIQGMLESLDISYTSSSMMASSLLMDKASTKIVLKGLDIPHVDYRVVHAGESIDYVDIVNSLALPLIVKPARQGSSIGIGYVSELDSLKDAIELAFYYDNKVVIEHALENFCEYNVAVYRRKGKTIVSEIERPIQKNNDILKFDDKYMSSGKMNGGYREFPANIDDATRLAIEGYAESVYNELDMKGVARFDFLMENDELYLNEVNTIPGSMAYYLFENKGITYKKLIDDIIDESVRDRENNSRLIKSYNSSVLKTAKYAVNKLRK